MSSPARRIAIEVIQRVEQGGAFLNLALDGALRAAGALEAREAALATALAYGTVRWQLQLDRAIEAHSARPLAEMDGPVLLVLRLVRSSSCTTRRCPSGRWCTRRSSCARSCARRTRRAFVNAVLRQLGEVRVAPPPPSRESDPIGHVAALTAHPRWLVERWAGALGLEETEALCRANQLEARACVRRNRGRATLAEAQAALFADGLASEPGLLARRAGAARGRAAGARARGRRAGSLPGAGRGGAAGVALRRAGRGRAGARCLRRAGREGLPPRRAGRAIGPGGRARFRHARKAKGIAEAARRLGHANLEARAADATLPLPGEPPASFDWCSATRPARAWARCAATPR